LVQSGLGLQARPAIVAHSARANRRPIGRARGGGAQAMTAQGLMADCVSLGRAWHELNDPRNRPAPQATIEALIFSLRRGVNELIKPATLRRLSALAGDQLEVVCLRVQAFQPNIVVPWSADDVDLLISAWRKIS